jgi:hypothetical protein
MRIASLAEIFVYYAKIDVFQTENPLYSAEG